MDWCFEGGLPQAWEESYIHRQLIENENDSDRDILNFSDIFIAFRSLILGLIFGGFSLICEIFWHDFVEPLKEWWKIKREKNKFQLIKNLKMKKKRKFKVRKIQVRPVEIQE